MTLESSVVSPTESINPLLQAALGSLDIQLEEELARYQQQRAENDTMPDRQWENQPPATPGEAKGGSTTSHDMASPAGMLTLTTMVPGALTAANLTGDQSSQNVPPAADGNEISSPTNRETSTQGSAVGVSALVPIEPGSTFPDDYLSSSEELLRSLAKEEAKSQKKTSWLDHLLTPWGMASILLLLLVTGALAYLWQNQSLQSSGRSPATTGTQNPSGTNVAGDRTAVPPIADGPNLATDQEFADLDLGNLGGIEANPQPSPTVARPSLTQPIVPQTRPGTTSNGNPQNLVQALLPPAQQPIVTSVPGTQAPPNQAKPAPAVSQTTKFSISNARSTPNPNPQGRQFYLVMVDYTDDSSLIRSRKIAPDALPVQLPEGKKVQIATFFKESQAKASAARLRKQGMNARVYYSP
jgi:hypothetical protein